MSSTGRGTERQTGTCASAAAAESGSKVTTRSKFVRSTSASSDRRHERSGCTFLRPRGSGSVLQPTVSASRPANSPGGTVSGRKTMTTSARKRVTVSSMSSASAPAR